MPTLHLGVIDLPYTDTEGVTTGDVAGWLEDKYHILEIFSQEHMQEIADSLEDGLSGALESLLMGAPAAEGDPFAGGAAKIEEKMKDFISNNEMALLGYPGVPTQAALDRASGQKTNARKARKRSSNAVAVSFYDSGLYQSSMKAWVA